MRYFSYNSFWTDPFGNISDLVETFSEDQIRKDYYPYWYERMCKKYGKEYVDLNYSFEECLIDWIHLHWAWEV
jgi:hypothetical protein